MAGADPGLVSPGTLPGAAATQIPSATNATAKTLVSRLPYGSTFSAKITAAITPIQKMLMTPRLNKTTISPQQQPTQ